MGHGKPGYVRREAMGPLDALAAIRGAGGLPVLAHFATAPERPSLVRDLVDAGLAGIEVHHRSFDAATVERMRAVASATASSPRAARTSTATRVPTRRRSPRRGFPTTSRRGCGPRSRATCGGRRPVSRRELPVLEISPPAAPDGVPRPAVGPLDGRVAEFRPEDQALPRFWVWTLGCQMNRSDSEEMAGRLLAAGCAEAPSMEAADLVVINTCAIREAAEAKVIGRQGVLRALKGSNPGMRVVLTGCAVRERDRGGLARRFPAVDLFLRPDEEPELVERLGLGLGPGAVGLAPATAATTHREGRRGLRGGPPRRIAGDRRRRGRAPPGLGRRGMAADHLRLRQDLHLLHRPLQPRPRAEPPLRRDPRRGPRRWPRPGIARSRSSART